MTLFYIITRQHILMYEIVSSMKVLFRKAFRVSINKIYNGPIFCQSNIFENEYLTDCCPYYRRHQKLYFWEEPRHWTFAQTNYMSKMPTIKTTQWKNLHQWCYITKYILSCLVITKNFYLAFLTTKVFIRPFHIKIRDRDTIQSTVMNIWFYYQS